MLRISALLSRPVNSLAIASMVSAGVPVLARPAPAATTSLDCSSVRDREPSKAELPEPLGALITTGSYEGVVVHSTESSDSWTPDQSDVRRFEAALDAYVRQHPPVGLSEPLHRYKRRYLGGVKKGKRVLIVSFFHETTGIVTSGKWDRMMIGVAGGGECYLRGWYEPTSDRILELSVNALE